MHVTPLHGNEKRIFELGKQDDTPPLYLVFETSFTDCWPHQTMCKFTNTSMCKLAWTMPGFAKMVTQQQTTHSLVQIMREAGCRQRSVQIIAQEMKHMFTVTWHQISPWLKHKEPLYELQQYKLIQLNYIVCVITLLSVCRSSRTSHKEPITTQSTQHTLVQEHMHKHVHTAHMHPILWHTFTPHMPSHAYSIETLQIQC